MNACINHQWRAQSTPPGLVGKVSCLVAIIISISITTNCFGQRKSILKGGWVIEYVVIHGQSPIYAFMNGTPLIDTIRFGENTFEQTMNGSDSISGDFRWTQKGKYEIIGKTLILKDRVTSTGQPGKEYPNIVLDLKIKKGKLMLRQQSPHEETWLWSYYKRL